MSGTATQTMPRWRGQGRAFAHIAAYHAELTAFRRDLHAHPELGYEEVYTAGRVVEALKVCGVDEIHTQVGKTGVVAVVHGERRSSGRMLGLRADMDALPLTEHNEFAWRSTKPGRMHGCGHDGHTAMLVGAARYLAETRRFDGSAVLIFQPGEEGECGGIPQFYGFISARGGQQGMVGTERDAVNGEVVRGNSEHFMSAGQRMHAQHSVFST